jgi:hypothetical protein
MKRAVKGFAVAAVAFLLCLSLASAANRDNSWEVGGFIPYVLFDDPEADGVDIEIDDAPGFGVRGGYNITKNHEVEFTIMMIGTDASADHPVFGPVEADVDFTSLFYAGGGVRYFFNETFGLRFEGAVESVDADPDTLTNFYMGVGATFVLGG